MAASFWHLPAVPTDGEQQLLGSQVERLFGTQGAVLDSSLAPAAEAAKNGSAWALNYFITDLSLSASGALGIRPRGAEPTRSTSLTELQSRGPRCRRFLLERPPTSS